MFTFELVTLDGVKFGEEVYEVVLPTPEGYIAIFPHHMPLVSLVEPGVITIRRNENMRDEDLELFAINGGIVEIDKQKIRVLVDEANHSSELLEDEAKEALARSQELAKSARDQLSIDKAQQQVQISQARLRVAELRKRSKRR